MEQFGRIVAATQEGGAQLDQLARLVDPREVHC